RRARRMAGHIGASPTYALRLRRQPVRLPFWHGLPADAAWPPEPAWLVPGLDAALAHRLALRYGQLAYVCGDRETVAELRCSGLSSP
ncbi:MAG TPA: DUF3293 domain-containing protein, partial [Plasticicumulans sp.]|nr:DUF3293 domain-containing protein [Plasticicumulans sp.]